MVFFIVWANVFIIFCHNFVVVVSAVVKVVLTFFLPFYATHIYIYICTQDHPINDQSFTCIQLFSVMLGQCICYVLINGLITIWWL